MQEQFVNCATKITADDIKEIEKELKITFPDDFKMHYLQYNGGIVINHRYYMNDYDTYTSVNLFHSLKYHYPDIDNSTIEEAYVSFTTRKILPENLVPFASDHGSNQFCVDIKTGSVYLVYMDLGNPLQVKNAIRKIGDSFNAFIDGLEEEEEEDV